MDRENDGNEEEGLYEYYNEGLGEDELDGESEITLSALGVRTLVAFQRKIELRSLKRYLSIPLYWPQTYEGQKNSNDERHGFGKATLPNGDTYVGTYKNGFRHGRGIYKFKNGATYKGCYRDGLRNGKGVMRYPNKSKYAGTYASFFSIFSIFYHGRLTRACRPFLSFAPVNFRTASTVPRARSGNDRTTRRLLRGCFTDFERPLVGQQKRRRRRVDVRER